MNKNIRNLQCRFQYIKNVMFIKKEETMKGFKKLVSAFLVVAMVVTLVTITPSTDANAAVTI